LNEIIHPFIGIIIIFSNQNIFSNNITIKGSIQRIKVHGKNLENILEGDSAESFCFHLSSMI
jgi:hypothetical protein